MALSWEVLVVCVVKTLKYMTLAVYNYNLHWVKMVCFCLTDTFLSDLCMSWARSQSNGPG